MFGQYLSIPGLSFDQSALIDEYSLRRNDML